MRFRHRLGRVGIIAIVCLAALAPPAVSSRLLGIRTGSRGDSLRVVLDIEGRSRCELLASADGKDLVVVLPGICPNSKLPSLSNPHPLVRAIETRCDGGDIRVTIRGKRALGARTFWLNAERNLPGRFVLDLGPGKRGPADIREPATPEVLPREIQDEQGPGTRSLPPESLAAAAPPRRQPNPGRVLARQGTSIRRILIDPGHGGDDPGAVRNGVREKEIVLDVARRVVRILGGLPGYQAFLSRVDDRKIGLRQRHQIAEDQGADAFVSIHANASRTKGAIGVEVFFLSMGGASDEASRELARLENEADPDYVVEEDSLLQGIPFSFDLRQSDTLLRSSRLAEAVLTTFEDSQLAASRGVKQAGFGVLKSFQVPSILVEIGFLSNPAEAKRLKDPDHRERLAACIAKGAAVYFDRYAPARAAGDGAVGERGRSNAD